MESTVFHEFGLLWLVPVLPAMGAAVLGLLGRKIEYKGSTHPWGNDPANYDYDWHDPDAHGGEHAAHETHAEGHDEHAHDDHGHHLAPGQTHGGMQIINYIAMGTVLAAALITTYALITLIGANGHGHDNVALRQVLYNWIFVGNTTIELAFLADRLSIVMMMVITWIGFLIHLYSTGYMAHDPWHWRFMAYLNLFIFAMLILVMGDSLLTLFVGWEGVGLASYLLIGFWHKSMDNAKAAMKAFVVNRVGDFFFVIGMLLIYWNVGRETGVWTLNIYELSAHAPVLTELMMGGAMVVTVATLCLFIAATGKSAQIPLYVWLPDAMAGPTPVSALIHAATMVTAGVYMICRMNAFFALAPSTLTVIGIVATLTAFFSASIALVQNDIKKVLAYSTVSQLGFMFMGLASGAFWVGIFHVMTHAFFKACLFLGSGSVIHSNSDEQDMRKYGGLRTLMPATAATFMISWLAISGVPPLSGFFSKDEILHQLHGAHFMGFGEIRLPWLGTLLWGVASAAAAMTAFYMTRQVYMTFFGENRADPEVREHIHESPSSMTIPLWVLGGLAAVGGGFGFIFYEPWVMLEHWLHPVLQGTDVVREYAAGVGHPWHSPFGESGWATLGTFGYAGLSAAIGIGAILLGRSIYGKSYKDDEERAFWAKVPGLHKTLYNKYYVDEVYGAVVVGGVMALSHACAWFDRVIVDGIVNGVGWTVRGLKSVIGAIDRYGVDKVGVEGTANVIDKLGSFARLFQTGRIQTYLVWTFIVLLVLVASLQGGFKALF